MDVVIVSEGESAEMDDHDLSAEGERPGEGVMATESTEACVKCGDFVLVTYDGQLYPGLVKEKDAEGCKVNAMEASGGNWKWPKKDDVIWYPFSDIVQKIAEPKYLTRGIMEVKELKETYT